MRPFLSLLLSPLRSSSSSPARPALADATTIKLPRGSQSSREIEVSRDKLSTDLPSFVLPNDELSNRAHGTWIVLETLLDGQGGQNEGTRLAGMKERERVRESERVRIDERRN